MVGVNIAAFKDGKVLLTKWDDFRVWCLPGGHVEVAESLAQARLRPERCSKRLAWRSASRGSLACTPARGGMVATTTLRFCWRGER